MSVRIIWMPEAELTLNQNLDYLSLAWDNKVMNSFLDKLSDALTKLGKHPLSYPLHGSSKNIRKYNINKRITLYYKVVDSSAIELLVFWNTSRDPKSLKF